ncbi:hypothetical protein Gpo141_00000996 [Globisporangium polare]
MPNTAKSHALNPHGYVAAAREKLPMRQHYQQAYDPPQSTRPFMTMTAQLQSPLAAAAANGSQFFQQQQRRQLAPPPSASYYNSYSTQQQQQASPTGYDGLQQQQQQAYSSSRVMDADRVFEKLQPVARPSSNVSAAWHDEIEHRARVMDRSLSSVGRGGINASASGVGMKRPAPSASSSQRPVYQQYEAEDDVSPVGTSFSSSYKMSAFSPPAASANAAVALPTLSCLLQRNSSSDASSADSSSSRRNSILMMNNSSSRDDHQFSGKRQRMFVAPQPQSQQSQQATVSLPSSHAYPQAANLAGAKNEHLRKILEQEVAFYNQRSQQSQYQSPSASAVSAMRAPASSSLSRYGEEEEIKTTGIYNSSNNNSRKPVFYGSRPFIASSSSSRAAVKSPVITNRASDLSPSSSSPPPPPARRARHNARDEAAYEEEADEEEREMSPPPARPVYATNKRTPIHRNNSYSSNSVISRRDGSSAKVPLKYSSNVMTSSDDSSSISPREQLDRDTMDRDFVGKQDLSLNSPPRAPRRQHQYAVDTQRYALSTSATVIRQYNRHDETDVNSLSLMRTKSSSSGFRGFSSPSDHGESAIEAAAGLVEERSPSKRESITKLLLKSKEFLKVKSLVRNRNNEIDWVATFLNVGFESSSIYSLMCPLRKGRWKAEEEKYTMELLRLIESGAIRLRHGQSIRGFIAKKLHSDDMRVLKKLSNCKMFHFARTITPHMSEEEVIDERVAGATASLGRLEKLRSEFLRSVQLEALVAVRKYLSDSSIRELLNGRD